MKINSLPISTALIIIDMQMAYFKTPHLRQLQRGLVDHTNELIALAQKMEWLIVNITTQHSRDKHTWTLNMLEDDQGFSFDGQVESHALPELKLESAHHMAKTRDDAFHGTTLLKLLKDHSISDIVLAGVSAHSCIFHTAASAYANNITVTLYTPAIGDEDEQLSDQMIKYLRDEYRQQATRDL